MADPVDVSPQLRELLSTRIDSFDKLEIVLALNAAPDATFAIDELANTLKLPRDLARSACSELCAAFLFTATDGNSVRLLPPTDSDAALLAELAALYARDRVVLARVLSEIAIGRLRNMAARAFADAFVLRQKNRGDRDDG